MKKIIIPTLFIFLSTICFSQENAKDLTAAEKERLRQEHKAGLNFNTKSPKNSNSKELVTSNVSEEEDTRDIKTKVTYYYGEQDTTYKKFEYTKPD